MFLIPEEKMSVTVRDNIEKLQLVWSSKNDRSKSQWKLPKQYTITCLDVGGDEDIWDDSRLAETFVNDRDVEVVCPAIIFAPGKVIVALTFVKDQDIEETTPHLTLLTNDLRDRNEIASLVHYACSRNGPFSSHYNSLK